MANHRDGLFQAFRPLEKNALGHAPDLLLGFLVLDILDRRLAVNARQHQAAKVPHRHALEVAGCPLFEHESGEQRLPELAGGLDEELGDGRLMECLQEKVVQEKPGVEGRVAPVDHLEIDQRSEEHTSELQSPCNLVCRLLLEKKKKKEHKC